MSPKYSPSFMEPTLRKPITEIRGRSPDMKKYDLFSWEKIWNARSTRRPESAEPIWQHTLISTQVDKSSTPGVAPRHLLHLLNRTYTNSWQTSEKISQVHQRDASHWSQASPRSGRLKAAHPDVFFSVITPLEFLPSCGAEHVAVLLTCIPLHHQYMHRNLVDQITLSMVLVCEVQTKTKVQVVHSYSQPARSLLVPYLNPYRMLDPFASSMATVHIRSLMELNYMAWLGFHASQVFWIFVLLLIALYVPHFVGHKTFTMSRPRSDSRISSRLNMGSSALFIIERYLEYLITWRN